MSQSRIAWQTIPSRFEDLRHERIAAGAEAAGFQVRQANGIERISKARPGDILLTWNLHGTNEIRARAFEKAGGQVVVCEEGYTRYVHPTKHFAMSLHGHAGSGEWFPKDGSRWRSLGLELKPWRTDGEHILICGQRGIGSSLMASPRNWHAGAADRVRARTKRQVIVRPHPGKNKASAPKLDDQLANCWAVVVWSSACAVSALLAGIPVISEAPHHILGHAVWTHVEDVNSPPLTNRQTGFERMSWAQWSEEEIERGDPFNHLLA